MNKLKQALLIGATSVLAQAAGATVMTFEPTGGNGAVGNWNTVYDTSSVNVVFQTAADQWTTGYNNLTNVAYADNGSSLVIDFVALGGANVTLNGFDLGNYLGGGSTLTWSIYDLSNPGVAELSGTTTVAYSTTAHPSFAVGLSSTAGLRLALTGDLYNNAVDNISFSSTPGASPVPEPASGALLLAGLGLLALGTRRAIGRHQA